MKSKESEWRVFGVAAFLTVAAFLVMVSCATLPPDPTNLETQALIDCARGSECYVIHIKNGGWTAATLYLNGSRFAFVDGLSEATLPIPRSRLDGARCAQFRIKLLSGGSYYSSKECVRLGGRYTLEIDPENHIWLTPWGGRQ